MTTRFSNTQVGGCVRETEGSRSCRSAGSFGIRASHDPWRHQPGGRGVSDAKRLTEFHGAREKSWAESLRPTHSLDSL